jgi:chromosome segregation ATPase
MSLGLSAPARSVNFAPAGGESSHRETQHLKDVVQRLEQQLMQRFSKHAASRRSEGAPMQPWTSDPAAFSPLLLAYDARIAEMTEELSAARTRHDEQRQHLEKVSARNQELTSLLEAMRAQASSSSSSSSSSSATRAALQGDGARLAQAVPLLERKVAELESVIQLLQADNEQQAKQLMRGSSRVGHVQAVAETATDQVTHVQLPPKSNANCVTKNALWQVKHLQQELAETQAAFQQCKMELDSVSQSCVALKGPAPRISRCFCVRS